jgi:hypothetical protein
VRVVDADEVEAAEAELATALGYSAMRFAKNPEMKAQAQEMLKEAQARRDACFERLTFRELPAHVLEAIRTAYPDPEDVEDKPASWQNPFFHCLAATSKVRPEWSPNEWTELFKDFDVQRVADETAEWSAWCVDFSVQTWVDLVSALNRAQFRMATQGLPKG